MRHVARPPERDGELHWDAAVPRGIQDGEVSRDVDGQGSQRGDVPRFAIGYRWAEAGHFDFRGAGHALRDGACGAACIVEDHDGVARGFYREDGLGDVWVVDAVKGGLGAGTAVDGVGRLFLCFELDEMGCWGGRRGTVETQIWSWISCGRLEKGWTDMAASVPSG